MEKLKRIAAVNDISCLGKCSLTVALPIVSASGVECAVIPTAVLSTHTGGFTGYTCHDLTSEMRPIADHWKREGFSFDGIYTGYLTSPAQAKLTEGIIDELRGEGTIVIVDPAMADNGIYYSGFDSSMAAAFRELISRADVVTPNVTEASFITGMPYCPAPHSPEYIRELADRLALLGPHIVTITGIQYSENNLGAVAFDMRTGESYIAMRPELPGSFHGSGDVFASAYAALLVRGAGIGEALDAAVSFVSDSIRRTYERGTPRHHGMDFESALPEYIRHLDSIFQD